MARMLACSPLHGNRLALDSSRALLSPLGRSYVEVGKRRPGREQTITVTQKGASWELKREAFGLNGLNRW